MRACLLVGVSAVAGIAAASTVAQGQPSAGGWRLLPPAPIAVDAAAAAVWTGREMVVFGRVHVSPLRSRNVAAAYDPRSSRWRRLSPPAGPPGSYQGTWSAVWTGRQVLVWGPLTTLAFDPATNVWRRLPRAPTVEHHAGGIVVWTGREMVGWGGGCCGDAFADGAAFDPATNRWRRLPRAPLPGEQGPTGAWTGRELLIVGGGAPEGTASRRAAAYDPASNRWRRIPPLPAPRGGASAVWDGAELLVLGGIGATRALPTTGFGFDPASGRWRELPAMPAGRVAADAIWTGKRVLDWGGLTGQAGALVLARYGLVLDPLAGGWSYVPRAPLQPRFGSTVVWTGHELIVWGGVEASGTFRSDGEALAIRQTS